MLIVFAALLGSEPDPTVDETEVQRLVRAARTGDGRAARRLYALHVGRVFRVVRPLCASEADAEDAVQEAFANALTKLAEYQYRPSTRFVAWLATIAINVVRKRARSSTRVESLGAHEAQVRAIPAEPVAVDEDAERKREALLRALAELDDRDRQVVTLRYGGGLTAPEVAEALGLSSANVRKICERQRAVLLEKLKPFIDDEEAGRDRADR